MANRWFVENFENEAITFEENEVNMGVGVVVYNCKNCSIEVKGKFQGLQLNDSQSCKLFVDKVVSYIEISSCKDTEVTPKNSLKTIKVERS